jgi:hypothetical protein
MIELKRDSLVVSFPEVHRDARLELNFQRTLRIPDDDGTYALPPGLGRFPLRHVDDFSKRVPEAWLRRGGVMLPMYQSEALWIAFSSPNGYPFAVKVAAGKINAVTGDAWDKGLKRDPQDYLSLPDQPWLDGYCVGRGVIRQFVAMPLGSGYSAEEQITGEAEHGGIQIVVYPLKAAAWQERVRGFVMRDEGPRYVTETLSMMSAADMGLAPGGRMEQEIYDDPHRFEDWDLEHGSRCFVHLANSLVWRSITGENPPTTPPTAEEYTRAGLPWFEYYAADLTALEGSDTLKNVKSVSQLGAEKGDNPLPENESVTPKNVKVLRAGLKPGQVREGAF